MSRSAGIHERSAHNTCECCYITATPDTMELTDQQWSDLKGAYGEPYDPRSATRQLLKNDASAWSELWQELHHQGDIGEASYAAIPLLISAHQSRGLADWNTYALAATIEEARHAPQNPPMPHWLLPHYEASWKTLETIALKEFPTASSTELVDSIIAVLALAKKRITLGRMAMLNDDERMEMLEIAGWG